MADLTSVLNPSIDGNPTKLGFKLGTQAELDKYLSGQKEAVHGTFYLTQDTHRLYIGNTDKTLSPVNQGIQTVSSVADLPDPTGSEYNGQFYYITGGTAQNVLCVRSNNKWVQINNVSRVTGFENSISSSNGVVTIDQQISQSETTGEAGTPQTATFKIAGTNGVSVTGNETSKTIIISGNTSSIATEDGAAEGQVKINLTNSNSDASSTVVVKAGENTSVAQSNNTITINATDTYNTGMSTTPLTNGFEIEVQSSNGNNKSTTIDPIITYGANASESVHFSKDDNDKGVAVLDIYTRAQVDQAIKDSFNSVNAMTYKGAIESSNELPTTEVKIGDTYILSADEPDHPAGTLIIANGTEGSQGYITSTINWEYVTTSGNDTKYQVTSTTNGISIQEVGSNNIIGSIAINAGDQNATVAASGSAGNLEVETADSSSGAGHRIITIKHGTTDCTTVNAADGEKLSGEEGEFTYISGIEVNKLGHVTKITTKKYTIKPDIYTWVDSQTNSTSTVNTADGVTTASFEMQYALTNGNSNAVQTQTNAIGIKTSTLQITSDSFTSPDSTTGSPSYGMLTMDLVWGSF